MLTEVVEPVVVPVVVVVDPVLVVDPVVVVVPVVVELFSRTPAPVGGKADKPVIAP